QEELVAAILARCLNVLSLIRSHVYFPVYSNGLKDVAGRLGFAWTDPKASGLQSVVWRRRWEQAGSADLKEALITYNLEDCAAPRKVTDLLYAICPAQAAAARPAAPYGIEVCRVEQTAKGKMHGWVESIHAVPDFGFIHERASFDYLRDRICVR